MSGALEWFFEEQLGFRLRDGTAVEGGVFIGDTEFLPVEVLREDTKAYRSEFDRWLSQIWLPEQADRREQLLCIHGNRKRFSDLRDAVERQQVVPLVGSGMSVPSQLPTWSDLLRSVRRYSKVVAEDLEKLIATCQFEEAADLIASGSNKRLLDERIEHDLRLGDVERIDGPVRILPAVFPRLVLTTNLDEVLEYAFLRGGIGFDHVLAGADILRFRQLKSSRHRILLKLHGDCRSAATRVLLTNEYDSAYAPGSATREELSLLFRTNSIIFLGCSLGPDRTVRLIHEVASGDNQMPRHYAFLPLSDANVLPVEREQFLTEHGIYPIWYDGPHDEAISALLAGLPGGDGSELASGDAG